MSRTIRLQWHRRPACVPNTNDRRTTWNGARSFGLITAFVLLALAQSSVASVPLRSVIQDVRIDQRAGEFIPMGLSLVDEQGHAAPLSEYLANRPAALLLVYDTCPNLCPMLLRHFTQACNGIAQEAGRDFNVIVVSIDPTDTPALAGQLKDSCLRAYRYKRTAEAGWHFLVGGAAEIDRLKQALGYHSIFDAERHQYAHALGAMIVSPAGQLTHYFYGVDISPADLDAALKDAAAGKVTRTDHPDQQYCLDYSPAGSRYGRAAVHGLQALAGVWIALLLGYIVRELLRDWRKHKDTTRAQTSRDIAVTSQREGRP